MNPNEGDRQPSATESRQPPKPPWRERASRWAHEHPIRFVLSLLVLALIALAAVWLWRYFSSYESTDDAQVDAHLDPVGTRINGTVIGVYFENNQKVQKGQKLVQLDTKDYQVAVDQAKANLAQAQAELHAQYPNVSITETANATNLATAQAAVAGAEAALTAAQQQYQSALADLRQAEANNTQAQADLRRYRKLVEKDEISKLVWDQKVAEAKAGAAVVDAKKASAEAAHKVVAQRQQALVEAQKKLDEVQTNTPRQLKIQQANVAVREANINALKSRLDMAQLQLSYTTITAPVSGIAGNRAVDLGQRVQAGEQLLTISEISHLWVTANFKETEINPMRLGQPATIHVDALDKDFQGFVESFAGATGARYSLLPPENATGNYVKVVQRLPVRVGFKPGQTEISRLRPGMSVEVKVWLNKGR